MSVKKKKKSINLKKYISDEYVDLWNKDYYELDESQRIKMTNIYLLRVEEYESGESSEKLPPPFFMTQEDVIQKEQELRKQKTLEENKLKEEEEKRKVEILNQAAQKWQKESLVVLDKPEQLEIENFNLKINIVEMQIKQWEDKKKELVKKQEKLVEELAEKYEISVENYIVDPVKGVFIRDSNIRFPYNLENLPPE